MNNKIKSDKFSLRLYKEILLEAKKFGYQFPKLVEYKKWIDKYPKFLLLRHDIDISPLNALKMAEIEYSLGITANYYVLIHSKFYNPAAPPFFDALRNIADMGHEIGIHYDDSFFRQRRMDLRKGISEDINILENILGVKIKSISQHKPATRGHLNKLRLRYVNAYSDDLVNKATYISDSGFKWRNQSLAGLVGNCPRIYALIHPTTLAYSNLGMEQTYDRSSEIAQKLIQCEFSDFIKSTKDYLRQRKDQK